MHDIYDFSYSIATFSLTCFKQKYNQILVRFVQNKVKKEEYASKVSNLSCVQDV